MIPKWVPYLVYGLAIVPFAIEAHLKGSVTSNDIALISVSLSVSVIVFSVYFSLRTAYLYNARNADMTALRHDLNFPSSGAPDNTRRIAAYFLMFSEDYRRRARARTYVAIIVVYSAVLFLIALILALAFPGTIYWLSIYFLGVFFFGSAIIARQQNLGLTHPIRLLERMTFSIPPRGAPNSLGCSLFTYPPRFRLVTDQLEADGLGEFLRAVELAPDPKALSSDWLSPRTNPPRPPEERPASR